MTNNKKSIFVSQKHLINSSKTMSFTIFQILMEKYQGKNFKLVRLRVAFLILAITKVTISEILYLRVNNLKTLQDSSIVEIGNKAYFVNDKRFKKYIENSMDFQYYYQIKQLNDFIFTSEPDTKTVLRRETLTRNVNKKLRSVGSSLNPPRYLTSKSFQKWEIEKTDLDMTKKN